MTIHLPAETAMALALALTNPQYDLFAKRTAAEAAIEDLINFLDDTEGDCDLEPWLAGTDGDDREGDLDCGVPGVGEADDLDTAHDMSWPLTGPHVLVPMGTEDDEADVDDEEDDPCEPTMGRPDFMLDQSQHSGNQQNDDEETNEDGGDVLDEPHDDLELDGGEDQDWPSYASEMTYEQKAEAKREGARLLRQIRMVP